MRAKFLRKKVMKLALECKDVILERTLQLFLKEHLGRKKDCDFIVTDEKIDFEKPQFLINKHSSQLALPFSKEELFKALNDFDSALKELARQKVNEKIDALEEKIEKIAEEFRKDYQKDIEEAVLRLKDTLIKIINKGRR